ncbi:MAG: hypothetical protein [Circoviridae sp.]|nr:MAG: hypothetical protein [Circoviridae sp.]
MPSNIYASQSQYPNRYARSSTAKKASSIAKRRYINKPVRRALKTKKAKTRAKANLSAITTLSKQVRNLQLGEYGSKQYQTQFVSLDPAVPTSSVTKTTPLAYLFNNFYDISAIFQGTVAAGIPTVTNVAHWNKQTFDVDLQDAYQWNEKNNQDVVSTISYLPVYSKVKITFQGELKNTFNGNLRYRVTLFKLKNQPMVTAVKNFNMPFALGAYWHMVSDDVKTRNHFSKVYHEVLVDKYITFKPPDQTTAMSKIYRTVEIPYSFGEIKALNFDKSATPAAQLIYTNIPQSELMWCLISCNQDTAPPLLITMERTNYWRDKHGTMSA